MEKEKLNNNNNKKRPILGLARFRTDPPANHQPRTTLEPAGSARWGLAPGSVDSPLS